MRKTRGYTYEDKVKNDIYALIMHVIIWPLQGEFYDKTSITEQNLCMFESHCTSHNFALNVQHQNSIYNQTTLQLA